MLTRTDRRRFPILLAVIAALALAMLFSPVQAQEGSAPDQPTGLDATATHGQVVLTWDDPGDDSITGYVILRRVRVNDTGGDFDVLVADTGTDATTYTDDTVAAGLTYTYRIKAINEHGVSERSRWFHIDTPAAPAPEEEQAAEPPDQPTGLTATATHDSVTLTWDDPQDDSITGYVILRRVPGVDPEGQFSELVSDTGTDATTYTDDTVSAETRYTYRIKAINEHGVSERSRWVHIDTPAAPAPEPPANNPATGSPAITGTAQVGETLTVDTSGIGDEDGLENAAFSYQWLADGTAISAATANAYTPVEADEGKAITVQVNFTDDAGNDETLTSAPTDAVAAAQPTEPPAEPTGLEATATHDSVTLTWDDPGDDSITGYVVLRRVPGVDPEGQFSELVSDTGTDATTYTDDTVSAETRYTYRIKAINEHGTSERSRWVHINVPAAPEAAEGDEQDGEGDGGGAPGAPGKRANVSEGGTDCPATTDTTCEVDVGGKATGEISSGTDQDWFKVELEADTRYQIDLEGKDTGRGTLDDPRLLGISNSAGVAIADTGNLDSGVGENSRVIFEPNASGAFYISAWLQTGEVRRTYTLSVIVLGANGNSEADTDFPATTATTGRVEVGASATGNIRNNNDQDWFRVDLEADKQYQFDQEGAPTGRGTLTDPRLALFSGSGISLAINDDISSTNLNSRIVRTATETGAHYLRATRSFGNTGTYTLSVHDITPPPCTLNEGDIWCGVVDVEAITNSNGDTVGHGFLETTGDIDGNPDDKEFTVPSTNNEYTITSLLVGAGLLVISLDETLSEATADNDRATLELGIDGVSDPFPLSNTFQSGTGYRWNETGLDWSMKSTVTVRLREEDPPTLSVADATGAEGDDKVVFTVTLSKPRSGESTATWTASIESGDTAVAADLGTTKTGTVAIAAGATTATFEVPVVDDETDEDDETFTVTLSSPYPSADVKLATDATATGTIEDDDATDDCPNDTTTTCAVDAGGSATGTIETEDDLDWFKVELEAGTRYQIDMEGLPTSRGTMSDPNLVVRSAAFAVLATDDDGGVGANSRVIYTPTAAGTHYLEARAVNDDTGAYTLSVIVLGANGASEADTDFPVTTSTTGRVDVGASATGNIESDSDKDWFRVDLEAGKLYQIDLEGVDGGGGALADPFLSLLDGTGSLIADNDDSGGSFDSRIVYVPATTGAYYTEAKWAAAGAPPPGTYTLSVTELETRTAEGDTDFASSIATLGMVEVGGSATGEIDPADDIDWFRVVLEAGKTYVFGLKGNETDVGTLPDPLLLLWDSPGLKELARDNDGGDGSDSRLEYTATASGIHYLDASAAGDASSNKGTYTLSVREVACTLNEGDYWCGVVTVGEYVSGGITFAYGFVDATTDTGALSDTTFDVSPNSYTIDRASVGVSGNAGILIFSLTSALTEADRTKLVLHVDGSSGSFAFDGVTPTASFGYRWDMSGLDWSSETSVTLRLRDTPVPCTLETGDIWCGVVTVGDVTNSNGDTVRHGFQGTTGGLSDETFSLMFETGTTNNYTITAIVVGATTATSEQLYFVTSSGLTDTEEESLALHVDGESAPFVWSDSTEVIPGSYRWPARTDLDWSSETTVTLRLREFPRPTVTNVAVTSMPVLETDTYGAGETIEVSVTFSEAVDATSDTDFVLSVAGVRRAPLLRGSGTATLVFGYTVVSSDEDTNGIWIGDETRTLVGNRNGEPQNGTITSVANGAAAVLDHTGLSTVSDHKVDGSRTASNTAPSFSSSATFDNVAENQTAVGTVAAADSDADDSVTGYAITGGADQTFFSIGATSGVLTFDAAPNFEDAQDQGTNNTYVVDVTATSGTGTRVMTATQTIAVTVVDVAEQSAKPAKPVLAKVTGSTTSLTATWEAPGKNGGPAITGYKLEYRAAPAGTWMDFAHTGTGVTATITGLTADTSYQARVLAENGETDSDWSDASDAVSTNAPAALPTLSIVNASATENSIIFFPLTLSATASANVTVSCVPSFESGDTAVAADLSSTTGTATIEAGSTSGQCPIRAAHDTIDEEDETFTVTLSGVSSNAQLATDPTAKGTILDDDPPVLSFKQSSYTAAEGGSAVEVELMLTSALPGNLLVTITAVHGAGATAEDYTGISDGARAIFTAGQTRSVFEVTAFDDAFDEADETVTFGFTIPSSADVTKGSVSEATLTLTDNDDPPTLSVGDVSGAEGTALTFTVTLSAESGKTVTVDYATSVEIGDTATSGTDFTAKTSTTLTFEPGDPGDTTKTFTVQTTDDTDIEEDETFTVTLSNPSNATISDATATGTINDDDATDDCSATTTTTCEVDVGGSATGTSESAGDFDWFRVVLEADTRYQIDLEGAATVRGTLANPAVSVRDASATNLASDDNSGVGNNARVIYTPTAAGAYYVQTVGISGGDTGTYALSVIVLGANGELGGGHGLSHRTPDHRPGRGRGLGHGHDRQRR